MAASVAAEAVGRRVGPRGGLPAFAAGLAVAGLTWPIWADGHSSSLTYATLTAYWWGLRVAAVPPVRLSLSVSFAYILYAVLEQWAFRSAGGVTAGRRVDAADYIGNS